MLAPRRNVRLTLRVANKNGWLRKICSRHYTTCRPLT